jgi:DNA-binding transcriptional MerR regulator
MRTKDEMNWDKARRHYQRVKVLEESRDYGHALKEAEKALSLCPEQRADDTLSQYTLRTVLEKKVARLKETLNEAAKTLIEALYDPETSLPDGAALALQRLAAC